MYSIMEDLSVMVHTYNQVMLQSSNVEHMCVNQSCEANPHVILVQSRLNATLNSLEDRWQWNTNETNKKGKVNPHIY